MDDRLRCDALEVMMTFLEDYSRTYMLLCCNSEWERGKRGAGGIEA